MGENRNAWYFSVLPEIWVTQVALIIQLTDLFYKIQLLRAFSLNYESKGDFHFC